MLVNTNLEYLHMMNYTTLFIVLSPSFTFTVYSRIRPLSSVLARTRECVLYSGSSAGRSESCVALGDASAGQG